MAGGGQPAVPVGRADRRGVVERFAGRVDDDERDPARPQLGPQRFAQVAEHRDDAGRATRQGALDPAAAGRPPALHLGQDDGQMMLAGDLFDAAHDLQRPLRLQFVEDELEDRCRPLGRSDR